MGLEKKQVHIIAVVRVVVFRPGSTSRLYVAGVDSVFGFCSLLHANWCTDIKYVENCKSYSYLYNLISCLTEI